MEWLDNLLDIAQKHVLEPTKLKDGLHGREHWKRVAMMAEWLSEKYGGNRGAIISGAVLHDIGRLNDKEDPRHGFRGVVPATAAMTDERWLLPDFQLPKRTILPDQKPWCSLSLPQIGKACCAIAHHCLGQELQPTLEMKLVRLADQLDLFRIADPKRWPDPMHMEPFLYTHGIREKARAFVQKGERLL